MWKGTLYVLCGVVLFVVFISVRLRTTSMVFSSDRVHMVLGSPEGGFSLLPTTPPHFPPETPPKITEADNASGVNSQDTSVAASLNYSPTPPYYTTASRVVQKSYSDSPPYQRPQVISDGVQTVTGHLNFDLWHWIVGYLVDDMRTFREFPLYPNERGSISQLHVKFNETDPEDLRGRYAHRIYGYITPPEKGSYSFKVELTEMTAAAEVELWLSGASDPLNMSLILNLLYDDLSRPGKPAATAKSEESKEVQLDVVGPYYFEFLQKAYNGSIVSLVKWKTPSSKEYVAIPSSCFTMAVKLDGEGHFEDQHYILNTSLPSVRHMRHHLTHSPSMDTLQVTDLKVLPDCDFKAVYAQARKVKHMKGFYQVHESFVYPKDASWFKDFKKSDKGNKVIDTKLMQNVVSLYTKALTASRGANASVVKLRYMEQTTNKEDGSRFLLEMDVQLHQPKEETVHTSEYVYLKKGSSQLCHTSNFQWTKDVDVHFVVSVKNLGQWVKHLIYNIEDIYAATGDDRFSLIMVDYMSEDMDIEKEANKSSFKRITVMHLKGNFTRAGGLQVGIDSIKDDKSIIMALDMHLTLPMGFVQYIRKRNVQGKMGFGPLVFKLNRAYTEVNYNGCWRVWGYGIFSMYKSDWIRTGGYDTDKYTTKWGDEDWDLLDRVLSNGIEAYRIRPPGYVHYHHSHNGLWGTSDIGYKEQHWTLQNPRTLQNSRTLQNPRTD